MSVVPRLFSHEPVLSWKMLRGFLKMGYARRQRRYDAGFNHMKNLCLVYFKLTPLCNLHCVMCGQRGDKGVLKGQTGIDEAKTIVSLERYKEIVDELAVRKPIAYLWGGEPFLCGAGVSQKRSCRHLRYTGVFGIPKA
jgi:sulfatase maturation enzyme AslB (radical SAM superfamily)